MATMNPQNTQKQKDKEEKDMKISNMAGGSKRLTLTYIVLIIWLGLAIFAIVEDADFYGLAVYFASGLPLILGYLWSETSRPTIPSMKDVSDLVKNIGSGGKRDKNHDGGGGYGGYDGGYGGYDGGNSDYSGQGQYTSNNQNNQSQDTQVSIFSDDASTELKITQEQLTTLKNIGYVDLIGDKNTFKKSLIDQIKSLISDNGQQPTI